MSERSLTFPTGTTARPMDTYTRSGDVGDHFTVS